MNYFKSLVKKHITHYLFLGNISNFKKFKGNKIVNKCFDK